ncbi:MAG: hypothetical protein MZU97_26385 [Bacillus subtilis]|nr:hypothetical protein [Bacillus subtilis]
MMRPLMQYVDVCIGNEEDAELVLGFKPEGVGRPSRQDSRPKATNEACVKWRKSSALTSSLRRCANRSRRRRTAGAPSMLTSDQFYHLQALRDRADRRPRRRRRFL